MNSIACRKNAHRQNTIHLPVKPRGIYQSVARGIKLQAVLCLLISFVIVAVMQAVQISRMSYDAGIIREEITALRLERENILHDYSSMSKLDQQRLEAA